MIIRPMLAHVVKDKHKLAQYEGTHIAQTKFDGTRIIAEIRGQNVTLTSRTTKTDYAHLYPEIVTQLRSLNFEGILDGELMFYNIRTGRSHFIKADGLPETRRPYRPVLHVFDILFEGDQDCRNYQQRLRSSMVDELIPANLPNVQSTLSRFTGFDKFFKGTIECGGEGIILKQLDATYRHDGVADNRSKAWLKCKKSETTDCVVLGLQRGEGKFADMFGALVLGQYAHGVLVEVGRTSGMTDAERAEILEETRKLEILPTHDSPSVKKMGHMLCLLAPTMVVEVEFMERTAYGALRHPRFIRVRPDKLGAECTYDGRVGKTKKTTSGVRQVTFE